MNLEYVKIASAFILLSVTFLASMLPLILFRSSSNSMRQLRGGQEQFRAVSFFSCFGAGVFLGTCLLHLFPDVQEQMNLVFQTLHIVPNYPVSEFLLAFGFLTILIVEQIVLNCQDPILNEEQTHSQTDSNNTPIVQDKEPVAGRSRENLLPTANHHVTDYGAIERHPASHDHNVAFHRGREPTSILRSLLLVLALSFHSIFEGLAIGLQGTVQSVVRILIAVGIHKCIIAFTLGLSLIKNMQRAGIIKSSLFFSLTSPVGILIGLVVVDFVTGLPMIITSGILQGLAAGTFLYITLFEILPDELKSGTDRMVKMGCLVLGFSVVSILLTVLPE